VALHASLRKIRIDVVRVCGALEILQVTGNARSIRQVVVVVDVAIGTSARRHGVCSRQREVGKVVIESRVQPGACAVVALRTIGWEVAGNVVWVRGRLKIFQMATRACGGGQVVIVIDVAVDAFTRRHGMSAGQQEAGKGMIKFGVQPVVGAVATLARGGKLCGNVIGIVGRLKVLEVARIARRRHRFKLAVRRAFVTSIAIDSRMRSGQWKAIIVLLDLLRRYGPSAHAMALLAIGS
jgi:hypothetical protein